MFPVLEAEAAYGHGHMNSMTRCAEPCHRAWQATDAHSCSAVGRCAPSPQLLRWGSGCPPPTTRIRWGQECLRPAPPNSGGVRIRQSMSMQAGSADWLSAGNRFATHAVPGAGNSTVELAGMMLAARSAGSRHCKQAMLCAGRSACADWQGSAGSAGTAGRCVALCIGCVQLVLSGSSDVLCWIKSNRLA
eukprot:gene3768-biopygen3697